mgnify:CR=1 FL=1
MPSKRTFAKRLAALVVTGLGVTEPTDMLNTDPPPDATLGVDADGSRQATTDAADQNRGGSRDLRSAVANGAYQPAAAAAHSVDTVVTARLDPAVVTTTGLPSGIATTIRQALTRYESLSLGQIQSVAGGGVFTADGPAGCAVAVGDIDATALRRELNADTDVTREPDDGSGFARFKAQSISTAFGVRSDEVVVAHGPTIADAVTHRDAGVQSKHSRRTSTNTHYGSLPSLLRGDATVCVDLGTDVREQLQQILADAPEALRTAVDASAAVGVGVSIPSDEAASADSHAATGEETNFDTDAGATEIALRYGAVADPTRLDRDTAEAVARAARTGDHPFADATVSRHGRTVTIDATTEGDLFASHASLTGVNIGDRVTLSDP